MTHFPRTNANQRSPRVQLNGSVAAAVMAEGGQRARAKLQSISINGGLLQLQHELSTGDFVEIAFHTRSGAICGMAEMLNPTRKFQSACLQPFRFIALATTTTVSCAWRSIPRWTAVSWTLPPSLQTHRPVSESRSRVAGKSETNCLYLSCPDT
jgi:hypothetical protein